MSKEGLGNDIPKLLTPYSTHKVHIKLGRYDALLEMVCIGISCGPYGHKYRSAHEGAMTIEQGKKRYAMPCL